MLLWLNSYKLPDKQANYFFFTIWRREGSCCSGALQLASKILYSLTHHPGFFRSRICRARASDASMSPQTFSSPIFSKKPPRASANNGRECGPHKIKSLEPV
jgi:hypothetical protein